MNISNQSDGHHLSRHSNDHPMQGSIQQSQSSQQQHQQQYQQYLHQQPPNIDIEAMKLQKKRQLDWLGVEKERILLQSRTNPHVKHFEPYFTPEEVEILSNRQNGKMTSRQSGEIKRFATSFIERLGHQLGFPRRTISTAQLLYNRFHLFYPLKDFSPHDVGVVTTFTSAKMHDTLKKLHQVILASLEVRFPDKFKDHSIDDNIVEHEKKKILPIERLLLESISFSFKLNKPFDTLIKLCRKLDVSKEFSKMCWKILADSYRTLSPLIYSPYTLALSSIYLTSIFLEQDPTFKSTSRILIDKFESNQNYWLDNFGSDIDSIENVTHKTLDLFNDEKEFQTISDEIPLPDFLQIKIRLRENSNKRNENDDQAIKKQKILNGSVRSYVVKEQDLQITPDQTTRYLFE